MVRIFAAIAFLSVSAMADTGPCSAGLQDPPVFAVVLGSPVVLSFRHTTSSMLTPPSVTVVGHQITAWQLPSAVAQSAVENCNSHSVSLGDLEPGSYGVTWNYQVIESAGPRTHAKTLLFSISVRVT